MHTHIRFICTRKEQYFAEVSNNLARSEKDLKKYFIKNHQNNYIGN